MGCLEKQAMCSYTQRREPDWPERRQCCFVPWRFNWHNCLPCLGYRDKFRLCICTGFCSKGDEGIGLPCRGQEEYSACIGGCCAPGHILRQRVPGRLALPGHCPARPG